MSKLNKIIKNSLNNLLETKGYEDMEVAFGVRHKSDNLSDAEKNQFGPMGQLKTNTGGTFTNPKVNGTKIVDKVNKEGGADAQAYYKEVAKKVRDYQTPNDKEKFDAPRVPTNTDDKNERLEVTGYDTGVSGVEVTADLASKKGGSEATKKIYKDRVEKLQGDKSTYEKLKKNAEETNNLKYNKDAQNTRPVKSQTSKQPENMEENIEYRGVNPKNVFKANGKLVSEQQVLKLANKIPSRVKIDETTFAITDGENTYRMIWEGDSKSGEATIINFKNNQLVKEDIEKMKHLWGFKTSDSISTKKNITESGEDAFKRLFKLLKEEEGKTPTTDKEKEFASLAEPKDKITYADKIAGAKKNKKDSEDEEDEDYMTDNLEDSEDSEEN